MDTVILTIPKEHFEITEPWKFKPNAEELFKHYFISPYMKCTQNATKEDIENLYYKPRLTLFKRSGTHGFQISLHIEFSVPKLIFGNNFDEIDSQDIPKIIPALQERLKKMGIMMKNDDVLVYAKVKTVHFGKNIVFKDHTTVSSILSYFRKIKLTRKLDLNTTHFENDGEAVRYHSKTFQVIFYDKIEELKKSQARALEKNDREYNFQYDVFEAIRKKVCPLEVLRIEIRLIGKQAIKRHFNKLGIDVPLTFQGLLRRHVFKDVLLDYWQNIKSELKTVLMQDLNEIELFELIAKQKKEARPEKVLSMMAINSLVKECGYRTAKKRFGKHYSEKTFERIYKEFETLNFKIFNRIKPIDKITNDLIEFKSLKQKDFDLDFIDV